jgi:hypothetical protein
MPQVPAYQPFSFPQMFESVSDSDVTIGKVFAGTSTSSTSPAVSCSVSEPTFRSKTLNEFGVSATETAVNSDNTVESN